MQNVVFAFPNNLYLFRYFAKRMYKNKVSCLVTGLFMTDHLGEFMILIVQDWSYWSITYQVGDGPIMDGSCPIMIKHLVQNLSGCCMTGSWQVALVHERFVPGHTGAWHVCDRSHWCMACSWQVTLVNDMFVTDHTGAWHFRDRSHWCMTFSLQVTLVHDRFVTGHTGAWYVCDKSHWCMTCLWQVTLVHDRFLPGRTRAWQVLARSHWCMTCSWQVALVQEYSVVQAGTFWNVKDIFLHPDCRHCIVNFHTQEASVIFSQSNTNAILCFAIVHKCNFGRQTAWYSVSQNADATGAYHAISG